VHTLLSVNPLWEGITSENGNLMMKNHPLPWGREDLKVCSFKMQGVQFLKISSRKIAPVDVMGG